MSSSYIQIQWTAANLDEARRIGEMLIEKHLVACVHMEPGVESLFIWEGKIQTAQEVKVTLKTKKKLFGRIQEFISSECSYSVPEILSFPIEALSPDYQTWLKAVIE